MIVVQRVVTYWTKQSRGGAAASRRNAVPEAFAVPAADAATVLVHEVDVRERDAFAPSEVVRTLARLPDVDGTKMLAYGHGLSLLEPDEGGEMHLAVAGVNEKTRDAMRVCDAAEPVTGGVFLLEVDGLLRVVASPPLARSVAYGPRQIFVLEPGQYGRWRFNGRFTPGGCTCHAHQWWYEKWVVNVAYDAMPSRDQFTGRQPDRVVDNLVRLF